MCVLHWQKAKNVSHYNTLYLIYVIFGLFIFHISCQQSLIHRAAQYLQYKTAHHKKNTCKKNKHIFHPGEESTVKPQRAQVQ